MPAFLQSLKKIKPVYDATYQVILFICKILLIADIIITIWAVAGRYIPFITDPSWSEELVLTFMVYMAVLSAALAIRKRGHIRMTAFDRYLSPIKLCASPLSSLGRYISLPNLSKLWQYMSIPIAGAGMIIFELEQVILRIEAFYEKDEERKEEK